MKAALLLALALAGGIGPAAAASWGFPALEVQAGEGRGRHGGNPPERREPQGREFRPDRGERAEPRRERLNDDERRALHRDLDKASRELYQRRHQR